MSATAWTCLALWDTNSKGISHHKLCCRRVGRRQIIRASFTVDLCFQYISRILCQERIGIRYHSHDLFVTDIPDQRDQHLDFGGVPAFGNTNDDIVVANHPQITVDSVGRMHKNSRSTGRIESSHYFLGNNGTFTYTCNDHPSFRIIDQPDHFFEIVVDKSSQILYS